MPQYGNFSFITPCLMQTFPCIVVRLWLKLRFKLSLNKLSSKIPSPTTTLFFIKWNEIPTNLKLKPYGKSLKTEIRFLENDGTKNFFQGLKQSQI